jgi:hypothetical protein
VSEANPRTTAESTPTLRGQDKWPITPSAVTHPLRRTRSGTPNAEAGAVRRAPSAGPNHSSRPASNLPAWLVDPHPPRVAPYTGPDRRRHRGTTQATQTTHSRRRTDRLYNVPSLIPSHDHASTVSPPLADSVPSSPTDLASADLASSDLALPVTRPIAPAISGVPVSIARPSETQDAGLLAGPVPAPPNPSRTVFVPPTQGNSEATTDAEPRDRQERGNSRSKANLLRTLSKRRWVLPLAGIGILCVLVLGLSKCSSGQSSKVNEPSTSPSIETVGQDSPDAAAPKVIQRTVVGGRDAVGNGSIATDAITQTPRGVAVFADGRKLISDATSVRIIGRDGRIRALPDPTGLLQKPGAATPFGNDVVVIDQASAALVRIKADGTMALLSNDKQFRAPTSVTRFDDKTLVVADPGAGTLFSVAVNGDSASVSPLDVNPPLLRPTAVAHRGDQVLAVVDDADGAIYEVTKGTSRRIAQARSQRAGVSDQLTVNASDAEALLSPSTDVTTDGTTDESTKADAATDTTTAAVDDGYRESATSATSATSASTAGAVLSLPEPVVAIASRRDGSLWVLGRTSTLLMIAADNRGIPSVVSQSLNWPQGLGVDARGQALIADTGAHKVSAIDEKGAITNLAGAIHSPNYEANTTAADDLTLQSAVGFATTSTGDLYVADESANTIWGITAGGASYRLVGNGTRAAGSDGGQGPDTPSAAPTSLATAPDGSTYFAEPSTGRVRKVDSKGIVSTVFDQFGGPITLPEVVPPPAEIAIIDPAALAIAPTTTAAPPSAEVLQERRRLANIEVGRLGLIAVTNDGTLVAVDTWRGTLGTIREGIFTPKETLRSQPIGLSIARTGDTETIAISERERVELFSGSVKDTKGLTRTAVEPSSGTANESGTNFGGITSTENGAFAVVTLSSLGSDSSRSVPDSAPSLQAIAPGTPKAASPVAPGVVSKVPLSGPNKLGALGALPTGELVQFSSNGGLFAQFPAPPVTVSSTVSATASSTASAEAPDSTTPTSSTPVTVFRWLTNPPQSPKETRVGRTPIQDPGAMASQADGTLVFAENGAGKVRMLRNGNLTVLAGSGRRAPAETRTDATAATFDRLSAVAPHANGGIDFSTPQGLTGIDSVGLVRRNEDPSLAGAALTVTSNDETVVVNNRTGLLQRITKSGTFEDLPGTRIINASQLTAVGERFYVLTGPPSQRAIAVRRGTSEATVTLPADTVPLAFTADETGTLYVLDTQHRLLRLRQGAKSDGEATNEKLDGWKLVDTTKVRFADDRYVGSPDSSDPQAMAVAGPGAVAISDAGTDSIVVVRFPQ